MEIRNLLILYFIAVIFTSFISRLKVYPMFCLSFPFSVKTDLPPRLFKKGFLYLELDCDLFPLQGVHLPYYPFYFHKICSLCTGLYHFVLVPTVETPYVDVGWEFVVPPIPVIRGRISL